MVRVLTVRLLGKPALERDGLPVAPPRGKKAWALLAYLLVADSPPSRQRLVSLLFSDTEDPLGALRWNLSTLRGALGPGVDLGGDPLVLRLVPGDRVDVHLLESTDRWDVHELVRIGGEFLEGVDVDASPAFESWLLVARQRLRAGSHAVLYEAALHSLVTGEASAAAALAARAVELDPYNGDYHAVLVRALALSGDRRGAERQVEIARELFRDELGLDLPDVVRRAGRTSPAGATEPVVNPSRASARSYLEAGAASLAVGAADVADAQLRRAVQVSRAVGDQALAAQALVTRAGGMIHGAGGRGAEVAALLHEGLSLARQAGADPIAAAACRELAFLGVQLGHHERADAWLDEAERFDVDDGERARQLGVRGMNLSDAADYAKALRSLDESIACAQRSGLVRQAAWSRAMVGRIHVLRGEPAQAAAVLDESLDALRETRWLAFLPWAEAFRAEAALQSGHDDVATELLDHAWVLATEAGDHCWMATVARGQALLAADQGRADQALAWIETGLRPSPWYLWPVANLLDAGCRIAEGNTPALADEWSRDLYRLSARGGLREHVVRAQLSRGRRGEADLAAAARLGAADIDNLALHDLVAAADDPGAPPSA